MTDRQQKKYSMFRAVVNYCQDHESTWTEKPLFVTQFTKVNDDLALLEAEADKQSGTTTIGTTQQTRELRSEIARELLPFLDALQFHAALNDDTELAEDASFTKSEIAYGRLADNASRAQNVIDLVDAQLTDNLADYELEPTALEALREKVATFRESIGKTRAKIAKGTVTTGEILRLIDEIDEQITNRLDKAAATFFRVSNPQFFSGYLAARVIVD